MNVNTYKALKKISELMDKLQKSEEFEEIHEETLNLCRIVFGRKSDYKKIDIHYPEEIKIQLTDFSGKEKHEIIDGNPDRKNILSKLKEDTLSILHKLSRYFRLRKELDA
jgi:hypothetical protein